ncbi:cyclic lactone autoinducer peptide [Clostridium rectalis]|nr:cyclic lactone autoinducer peptide [Clostridium rectalis]
MKNKVMKEVAKVCKTMAKSTSASACTLSFYQPKEPKSLRK